MIVLGVDAGVTTGLAIVSGDDQRVLYHGTAQPDEIEGKLHLVSGSVDKVVVERSLPYKRSRLGRELMLVHTLIERSLPNSVWIDASQWKNTDAKYLPVPRGISTHERDAIRIARWYLIRFESELIAT